MFILCNPNPKRRLVIDCTVRAISILLDVSWLYVYDELSQKGREMYTPFVSNDVWDAYLREIGFKRYSLPNTCPDCYSVRKFCQDFQNGKYLLAIGDHVVAVIDGDYYDTWDSGDEIPIYYYTRRN